MKKTENQVNEEIRKAVKLDGILESLTNHFNTLYPDKIDRNTIFDAIFILLTDKYKLEHPGDLWGVEVEYDETLQLLYSFDFNELLNSIETDVDIIPREFLMEFKVKIKSRGLIWIIHKNVLILFPQILMLIN